MQHSIVESHQDLSGKEKKKKKVNLLGYKYKSFPESSPSQDVLKSTAVILVFIHFSSSFGPNFLISSVLTEPNWIIQLICSFFDQSSLVWHGMAWYVLTHLNRQKLEDLLYHMQKLLETKCFYFWAHLVKAKHTSWKKSKALITECVISLPCLCCSQ